MIQNIIFPEGRADGSQFFRVGKGRVLGDAFNFLEENVGVDRQGVLPVLVRIYGSPTGLIGAVASLGGSHWRRFSVVWYFFPFGTLPVGPWGLMVLRILGLFGLTSHRLLENWMGGSRLDTLLLINLGLASGTLGDPLLPNQRHETVL